MTQWSPAMQDWANKIKQTCFAALAERLSRLADDPNARLRALIDLVQKLPGSDTGKEQDSLVHSACWLLATVTVEAMLTLAAPQSSTDRDHQSVWSVWTELLREVCCPEAIRGITPWEPGPMLGPALKAELYNFYNRPSAAQ